MLPRPENQEAQEDAVLGSLLADMRSAGLDAVLVEIPDRLTSVERRVPDLTTDALIEVDGAMWSVDVMSVAAPVDLYLVPEVGSSRVDLQACKLEYSIVSPK